MNREREFRVRMSDWSHGKEHVARNRCEKTARFSGLVAAGTCEHFDMSYRQRRQAER